MRRIGSRGEAFCLACCDCIFLLCQGLKQAQIRSCGFALIVGKTYGFCCLAEHGQCLLRAADAQGMQSGLASALIGSDCPLYQGRLGGCEALHAGCISQKFAIAAAAAHQVEQHGIGAGSVCQAVDSPLFKIRVLNVFQEHLSIVGSGAFLEQSQEESAIGIVGALLDGSSYAATHFSALGFVSGCHNVGGESEQSIFGIGVLARFGRHEHGSQLLHAVGAGSGKVVHGGIISCLGFGGHTIEHVGYHRSGGALTGILCQSAERHHRGERQGYE